MIKHFFKFNTCFILKFGRKECKRVNVDFQMYKVYLIHINMLNAFANFPNEHSDLWRVPIVRAKLFNSIEDFSSTIYK